jgi:hypothetical protein
MKIDEAILEELERGAGTVKQIIDRLSDRSRVYEALERLVAAKRVEKDGHPGKGNEKTYRLPRLPSMKRRV